MRKASRQMDAAFALEVLDKAPYVTVTGHLTDCPCRWHALMRERFISIVLWRETSWTA